MAATVQALRELIQRRFDPSQKRDPDGKFGDGFPGPRIGLPERTARVRASDGATLHLTQRGENLSIRIPFDGSDLPDPDPDDEEDVGPRQRLFDELALDAAATREFAEELAIVDEAGRDYNRRAKAAWDKAMAINPNGGGDDDPDPVSKAAWDAWGALGGDGQHIAGGQLSAEGGEVHYELRMGDEPGDMAFLIGLKSPDDDEEWDLRAAVGSDLPAALMNPAQLRKLRKGIDSLAPEAERARRGEAVLTRYSPDQVRAPAGSAAGGEFAAGGSDGAPKKSKKRAAPGATLSYNPRTNQGAGYGSAGGDARVKGMQDALNRLGLTDATGKPLKVDGKLGPKTTAAIKKLQTALGLTPNGRVTPALLAKIQDAKNVADLKTATAKGAKKTMPAKTKRSAVLDRLDRLGLVRSGPQLYDRSFPLDDIQISRSGDGRTVEAYAAMFEQPYEVLDQHGHYMETINRAAFNRTLSGGAGRNAMCLYNHGFTLHGTPSEMGSIPLGNPLEIKPDGRGLLTITRYNKGPFAEQVLESVRNGEVKAQSFRGRIVRSDPNGRVPKGRFGQPLPTITRHELGLTDYGPTPNPVNVGAEIVAVRSATDILDAMQLLDADERDELLRHLGLDDATPDRDPAVDEDEEHDEDLEDLEDEDEADTATSDRSEPGAEDPPAKRSEARHSGRLELARHIRAEMVRRNIR